MTTRPFHEAATMLLRERGYANRIGNVNLTRFAREKLSTIHPETLRKILAGDRRLDMAVIEEIAAGLEVEPSYFIEYRLMIARGRLDPEVVGPDEANRNLELFSAVLPQTPPPKRRPTRPRPAA